jgi:integrase
MARDPKPFPYRGWYVTSVYGIKNHKLCTVEAGLGEAKRLLRLHMTAVEEDRQQSGHDPGPGVRPAAPHAVTVLEAYDEFLDYKKTERSADTYDHYRRKLRFFVERFGSRPVSGLTERDGIEYKRWLMEDREWVKGKTKVRGVGPVQVNHCLTAANVLLNWAAERPRGYCRANPWAAIGRLTTKPRQRVLTDAEFAAFLAECGRNADFRELVVFLRSTAMRPKEVRTLEWGMVRWEAGQIVIPRTRTKTKTDRVITLTPPAADILRRRNDVAAHSSLVFLNTKGKPWTPGTLTQRFRKILERCIDKGKVERERAGERLVMYSTRHTRITEMIRDGVGLPVVSREAGHAQVSTTANIYTHLTSDDVRERVLTSFPRLPVATPPDVHPA